MAPPQRIYLSRKGVPTRRVANEEAVLAQLKPHGFVAVQSEQLSLGEQIALFRGATHIVAPHGASLTNLLHARGGSVLELFQEGHGVRPGFWCSWAALRVCQAQPAQINSGWSGSPLKGPIRSELIQPP